MTTSPDNPTDKPPATTEPAGQDTEQGVSLPWGAIPPQPHGIGPAYQAVGEVAAPLLAGFSVALIGVVGQSPTSFWLPGLSMLLLTLAVGVLLLSVQAGFHARSRYWTRDDIKQWFVDLSPASDAVFAQMNNEQFSGDPVTGRLGWKWWIDLTRRGYNSGISILGIALATILAPPETDNFDDALRWVAAGVAVALTALELVWWKRGKEPL